VPAAIGRREQQTHTHVLRIDIASMTLEMGARLKVRRTCVRFAYSGDQRHVSTAEPRAAYVLATNGDVISDMSQNEVLLTDNCDATPVDAGRVSAWPDHLSMDPLGVEQANSGLWIELEDALSARRWTGSHGTSSQGNRVLRRSTPKGRDGGNDEHGDTRHRWDRILQRRANTHAPDSLPGAPRRQGESLALSANSS
jgi:hypothetical protein